MNWNQAKEGCVAELSIHRVVYVWRLNREK